MTQNIYDNAEFFEGYSRLPRSVGGLDAAPEWPSLRALLPELSGRRVLDLGCGYGWFCRWARAQGAAEVRGLDVSERMLERARSTTADEAIVYARADLDTVLFEPQSVDLVFSSLTFHYLVDLGRLFREASMALRPGGSLVFSVEHPIYTAPTAPGFGKAPDGRSLWPLDSYLEEGPRRTDWLAKGVIKQHRTVGTYVRLLLEAGFAIRHLEEWGPTPEQISAHPEWRDERARPPFLLMAAEKA